MPHAKTLSVVIFILDLLKMVDMQLSLSFSSEIIYQTALSSLELGFCRGADVQSMITYQCVSQTFLFMQSHLNTQESMS